MKPHVGIVIPTYGGHHLVKEILEVLSKQTVKVQVVVVNNQVSKKYSIPAKYSSFASVINNERDLGLAGSLNKGIKELHTEIVITLHDDMLPLSNDWVEKLISSFSDNVGSVQSQYVIDFEHLTNAEKCFYYSYFMGKDIRLAKEKGIEPIKYGGDAADAFRYSALEAVDFFDTSFFTANEDTAMSVALRRNGYKLLKNNDCKTLHRFNKTSRIKGYFDYIGKAFQITENNAMIAVEYGVLHKFDAFLMVLAALLVIPFPYFILVPICYFLLRACVRSFKYVNDYGKIDRLMLLVFVFDFCYNVSCGFGWIVGIAKKVLGRLH